MISAFLKAHEKLIITIVVVLLCFHVWNNYNSRKAQEDQQAAHTAQITLQTQTNANAELAQQNQKLISNLREEVARLQTSNGSLAAKQAQSVKQIQNETIAEVDRQLSAALKTTIVPTSNGSSAINADSARQIVEQLNENIELKSELANEQQVVADLQKITQAQAIQITGLQAQIVDQTTACNAQIKAIKSKSRARLWKVIKIVGTIAFGIGIYAGHSF